MLYAVSSIICYISNISLMPSFIRKAFEAMFGCVTCLPGCFTMYRLASQEGQPLLSADYVYNKYSTNKVETLHEKNLFHLGEDRYLTTLLLLKFDDMKLSFVPEATCHTVVPHTFSILLSQRRRWINSTFHNMIELLRVNTMCGICCFSMRAIVVLDLISTFLLPACIFYIGYLCIMALFWAEIPPIMLLITIGLTVLVHIAVFLIRNRWDYWVWCVVYFLGKSNTHICVIICSAFSH
jgi:chitin synthase